MMVLTTEPTEFYAGDSISWSKSWNQYPASAGWVLGYKFGNAKRSFPVNPAAVVGVGDGFVVTIPATDTKTIDPAVYQLIGYVINGADRFVVSNGICRVRQDPASDSQQEPYDYRSQNERIYDAICAMIEGREDVNEHTIDGRNLKQMPIKDLMYWRTMYAGFIMRERGTFPALIGARFQ